MQLGYYETNHIYNEDCYKAIKNLPDKCIDLVYIDPPYEMDKSFGERLQKLNKITKETQESVKDISNGIDYSILDELCRVMKNIYIYIWCNDKQIIKYMNYFVNEKKCDYKILCWKKSNPMPMYSKRYLDDLEYCLLFKDKNAKFTGEDYFENSFKCYCKPINIEDKSVFKHPTIKPLDLVKNHIEKSVCKGSIVLDCFLGSGTTAVACKELGRQYIGFEIDKDYFKIAKDRLNGITASGQMSIFTNFDEE